MSPEIKKISDEIHNLSKELLSAEFDIEVLEGISLEFMSEISQLKVQKQLMITEYKKENQDES